MPKPAAAAKFALPPIHRGRLSNGMDMLVVENHDLAAGAYAHGLSRGPRDPPSPRRAGEPDRGHVG